MKILTQIKRLSNKDLIEVVRDAQAQMQPLSRTLPWTLQIQRTIRDIVEKGKKEMERRD